MPKIFKTIFRHSSFLLILCALSVLFIVPFMQFVFPKIESKAFSVFCSETLILLVFIATIALNSLVLKIPNNLRLYFSLISLPQKFAFGILIAIFWILASLLPLYFCNMLSVNTQHLKTLPIFYFLAMFANVIMQELVFRGLIFTFIRKITKNLPKYSLVLSFVGSAVLFSMVHGGFFALPLLLSLNICLAGVLFQLIVYCQNSNLVSAIVVHFLWNTVFNLLLFKPVGLYKSMEYLKISDKTFNIEGSWITTCSTLLLIVLLFFYHKRQGKSISPSNKKVSIN